MQFALQESRRVGGDHITPEHVLVGIINSGDAAGEMLTAAGIGLRKIRERYPVEPANW